MRADVFVAPIEDILADPHFFPARVDFERDCLAFVETSRSKMANSPFLDGRTNFSDGRVLELPLSEALAAAWPATPKPDRFIFHVAFCGSTLLATLLDAPGRSFAEREPNVLVDLANAAGVQPPALVRSAVDLIRVLLARTWSAGEVNICKPSNWVNNLIPYLTSDPHQIRPLFVTATKREYLYALFRGGRERIAYVLRSIDHLIRNDEAGTRLWQRAFVGQSDPLELAARIALVGLHIQLQLFEDAMRRGGWGHTHLLTLDDIEESPVEACRFASSALALKIPTQDIETAVRQRAGRYAKDPTYAYSPEQRRAENAEVERAYGRLIDAVLDWAALVGLKNDAAPALGGGRTALCA